MNRRLLKAILSLDDQAHYAIISVTMGVKENMSPIYFRRHTIDQMITIDRGMCDGGGNK